MLEQKYSGKPFSEDKVFCFKQLQDHDIYSPIDENVIMKKEVLLKIFNSLDLRPLITGAVFINHKQDYESL